jgi:predicted nucleotidyltransferase
MTSSETIFKTLKDLLPELREMGVKDLYVFGSVAREEAAPRDVDVLVDFEITPSLIGFSAIQRKLEAMLGKHVDLVTRRACPDLLYQSILPELRHVA